MQFPSYAAEMIGRLREAGFSAYAVGGCVRDSLLGREPNDWDITTSARPQETEAVFLHPRYRVRTGNGLKHGRGIQRPSPTGCGAVRVGHPRGSVPAGFYRERYGRRSSAGRGDGDGGYVRRTGRSGGGNSAVRG